MDNPDLTVSNFMEHSYGPKRVTWLIVIRKTVNKSETLLKSAKISI